MFIIIFFLVGKRTLMNVYRYACRSRSGEDPDGKNGFGRGPVL